MGISPRYTTIKSNCRHYKDGNGMEQTTCIAEALKLIFATLLSNIIHNVQDQEPSREKHIMIRPTCK